MQVTKLKDNLTAIADAIRIKTGKTDKIPFAHMAQELSSVHLRRHTGTITDTVIGDDAYAVLLKDEILKELVTNHDLKAYVKFDVTPQPYTFLAAVAYNNSGNTNNVSYANDFDRIGVNVLRYESTGNIGYNGSAYCLNPDYVSASASTVVGYMEIIGDELRMHSRSSNYAIRPSNYTIEITW